MNVASISTQIPGVLAEFPEISLVYLFGSQVSGIVGPLSDVDLAVLCDPASDAYQVQARFQHAMVVALEVVHVDVVLIHHAPIELAHHIISRGVLLYQRDLTARVEFEANILGRYGDYLPVLRFFQNQRPQGASHDRRAQRYREALGRTRRALGQARTPEGQTPRRV